jgi:hypothetical protein
MNNSLEDGICRRGDAVDGASAAGVLLLARWDSNGIMISCGSSPKIWLNFLACLKSLCLSLSSRSFVVGGSGIDRGIDDGEVLRREVLDDNMQLQGETHTRVTR